MSLLPRPRISELIDESTDRGITLLVAAAGYGKTEAVRDAYRESIYVALDPRCRTVGAIARAVIGQSAPQHARALGNLLEHAHDPEAPAQIASWVAARLRLVTKPIVLDDFHTVAASPEVVRFVRQLVEATRPHVRWIIASREQPDLPVTSWITRGWMSLPLSEHELQFTDDEAIELARAALVPVDDETVRQIQAETSGWPIALRLALSAWERTRALPPLRLRTREMLFDYIGSEIWAQIESADQRFLEAVALLVQPQPRILGEAGFANPGGTLARLNRQIPLVQIAGPNEYRLHELFRDYILVALRRDERRFIATMELVAGALGQLGLHVEALRLYVDVRDDNHVVEILEASGFELIEAGERGVVAAALEALGRQTRDRPIAHALHGYLCMLDANFLAAETAMRRALERGLPPPLRLETARRLAGLFTNQGRSAEAIALLEPLLSPGDSTVEAPGVDAKATLASARAVSGDVNGARALIEEVQRQLPILDAETRVRVQQRLAFAAFYTNDLSRAEQLALDAARGAAELGLDSVAAQAYSILISVLDISQPSIVLALHYAREMERAAVRAGDRRLRSHALKSVFIAAALSGDGELLTDAEESLAQLGQIRSFHDTLPSRVARVIWEVGSGNAAAAMRALTSIDAKDVTPAEAAMRDGMLALLYAASGEKRRADELLARPLLVPAQNDYYSRQYVSYAGVYRALAQWILGRGTAARRAIKVDQEALFERDRVIINAISSICAMPRGAVTVRQIEQLTEPLAAIELSGYLRFLRKLLESAIAPIHLTPTELEILRELRRGKSTAEIAAELGKATKTVSWHLGELYKKLGCSSRIAAIDVAESQGLL